MKLRHIGLAMVITMSFLAGTLVRTVSSQAQGTKYIQVDYMKVEPGNDEEYQKVELDLWKPIHKERLKSGAIKSWALYGLRFPSGEDEKYNYMTVNVFDKFDKLESPFENLSNLMKKAHPGKQMDDFGSRTTKSRRLVRSEVWVQIDRVE
jgi:hypothetical protein